MSDPNSLVFRPGGRGEITYARKAPTYIEAVVLSANANQTVQRPATSNFVLFSSTGDFYAKADTGVAAAAAVPSVTTSDGSASELNPGHYSLDGGINSIGLISPNACIVTLAFYE